MNTLFPLFVNLSGKRCTVVGGGDVARRKIAAFLVCGAEVQVIASHVVPEIRQLCEEGRIEMLERKYVQADIVGSRLVVAATNNPQVNRDISQDCAALRILCNVVDEPDAGDCHFAAAYTCGDLKMAISTNGTAPALARKLKHDLAEAYPCDEWLPYLNYIHAVREALKATVPDEFTRKTILTGIVNETSPGQLAQRLAEQEGPDIDVFYELRQWR